MTMDEAVRLVESKTGLYPISAFEFKHQYYVLATPLADYNPDEDVAQCYYPVIDSKLGEPQNAIGLFLSADDPYAISDAAEKSKSYWKGTHD